MLHQAQEAIYLGFFLTRFLHVVFSNCREVKFDHFVVLAVLVLAVSKKIKGVKIKPGVALR